MAVALRYGRSFYQRTTGVAPAARPGRGGQPRSMTGSRPGSAAGPGRDPAGRHRIRRTGCRHLHLAHGIRRGCRVHVVPATWLWHPCRIPPSRSRLRAGSPVTGIPWEPRSTRGRGAGAHLPARISGIAARARRRPGPRSGHRRIPPADDQGPGGRGGSCHTLIERSTISKLRGTYRVKR